MISLSFNQILIKLIQDRFNKYAGRSLLKIYIYSHYHHSDINQIWRQLNKLTLGMTK
jgi:hypothetical protein